MQNNAGVKPLPLPKGWVERQDAMGKIYYDNRLTHTTQWTRPLPKGFPAMAEYRIQHLPPVKFVLSGDGSKSKSKSKSEGNSAEAKASKGTTTQDKIKSLKKSSR